MHSQKDDVMLAKEWEKGNNIEDGIKVANYNRLGELQVVKVLKHITFKPFLHTGITSWTTLKDKVFIYIEEASVDFFLILKSTETRTNICTQMKQVYKSTPRHSSCWQNLKCHPPKVNTAHYTLLL